MLGYKPCAKCGGTGKSRLWDETAGTCVYCEGSGSFPPIDAKALVAAITTKGRLRKSKPRAPKNATLDELKQYNRAYYVWRMARFHGGADTHMPIMAVVMIEGDPERSSLDRTADAVARRAFGSDLEAVKTWAPLLGSRV